MFKSSKYNNLVYEANNTKYCYNAFSGELIKFTDEVYNYIRNISDNPEPEKNPYFNYLVQKGFLVDANTDEYEKIQAMRKEVQYSTNSDRASFVIALTTKCNVKCVYCYEEGCIQNTMTSNVAKQVIEFIKKKCDSNAKLKVLNLTWFGGEPLLAMENIELIGETLSKYCLDNGILLQTNIITNGLLLDDEKMNILKRYNLVDVQISMDGCEDYYHKYKGVNPNALNLLISKIAKMCLDTRITVRLNCSSENYESIKQLIIRLYSNEIIKNNVLLSFAQLNSERVIELSNEEFSKKKIELLRFLVEIGWKNQLKNFIPVPKTIPCGLMQAVNFVIDPNGYLYKCEHFVGNSNFSIGTVEKGILYPAFYNDFLECHMFEECKNCSIYPICRGGCSQKRFMGQSSVSCSQKQKEIVDILRLIIKENLN